MNFCIPRTPRGRYIEGMERKLILMGVACLCGGAFMLSGCSERAPGPAADMLRSGLNALKQKDYAGFQKYFLPEQQGNTYYEYWTKPN